MIHSKKSINFRFKRRLSRKFLCLSKWRNDECEGNEGASSFSAFCFCFVWKVLCSILCLCLIASKQTDENVENALRKPQSSIRLLSAALIDGKRARAKSKQSFIKYFPSPNLPLKRALRANALNHESQHLIYNNQTKNPSNKPHAPKVFQLTSISSGQSKSLFTCTFTF